MEGGVHKADKTEFKECLNLSWKRPFILQLAFSAGIGGFLFGYDTGVISGALLYIRDDFQSVDKKTVLQVSNNWRWMLGVAAVPAFIQLILMLMLPESPRWLFRKGQEEKAIDILNKIYSAQEVEGEIEALQLSVEAEIAEEGSSGETNVFIKVRKAWSNVVVRRGLIAGIGLQVAQQFVGINSVMYYSPTIVQLAGFASNRLALFLSLITSSLNAIGSIVSIYFVDKVGRRKLLIFSLCGIAICLGLLTGVFIESSAHSPSVGNLETLHFGNYTCPDYKAAFSLSWNCDKCLRAPSDCGFCAHQGNKLLSGTCLASNPTTKGICTAEHRLWYTKGCPSSFGWLALINLSLYIISYSPGMGTIPWIVNSEIYPLKYRGMCGGMAAGANWISNLIVSQTFLTLTESLGTACTFLLFGVAACFALLFVYVCVPETKGLPFEEVEKMLEKRSLSKMAEKSFQFGQKSKKKGSSQDQTILH